MFRFWHQIESSAELAREVAEAEITFTKDRADIALRSDMLEKAEVELDKISVLRRKTIEQMGELEHEYHQNKEQKNVEIAQLDAQILAKKEYLEEAFSLKNRNRELEVQNASLSSSLDGANKIIVSLKEQLNAQTEMTKVVITHLPTVSVKDVVVTQNNNGVGGE